MRCKVEPSNRTSHTLGVQFEPGGVPYPQPVRAPRIDGRRTDFQCILALLTVAGCNRSAPQDGGIDATASLDAMADAGLDASSPSGDSGPDADPSDSVTSDVASRPPWDPTLPPASMWGATMGYRSVRVIIHAHSVHSHDACDGDPYVDGGPNEPCLQSFRAALCRTKIDAVFLTEHSSLLAEGPFERAMQTRAGDEPEIEGGRMVGYRIVCADGHRVLVIPGAENELMPLALTQHPRPLDGRSLVDTYRTGTPAAVERFREAGGFTVISHAEQKDVALALSLRADGTELYNAHTNIDPRLASRFLGEEIGPVFADVPRFINPAFRTEPDLLFLGLFRENAPDLARWSALWRDGQRVVGVAGSDAHENSIPQRMADGERGDSYRRMFRWFSNEVLVGEPTVSRASLLAALAASRARVRFEAWGVAEGFQWSVREGATSSLADGATVSLAAAPVLEAIAPRVWALSGELPTPSIRVRILRADGGAGAPASGWTEVVSDASMARVTPTAPGIYRAEALVTPHHTRPYLPRLDRYVREVPWIYAAPVRVTE